MDRREDDHLNRRHFHPAVEPPANSPSSKIRDALTLQSRALPFQNPRTQFPIPVRPARNRSVKGRRRDISDCLGRNCPRTRLCRNRIGRDP